MIAPRMVSLPRAWIRVHAGIDGPLRDAQLVLTAEVFGPPPGVLYRLAFFRRLAAWMSSRSVSARSNRLGAGTLLEL